MEILFGLHPVEEALRSGTRKFDHICIARERQDARLEKLIQACRDGATPAYIEDAARSFVSCLRGPEGREGVAAFIEKRAPNWAERKS